MKSIRLLQRRLTPLHRPFTTISPHAHTQESLIHTSLRQTTLRNTRHPSLRRPYTTQKPPSTPPGQNQKPNYNPTPHLHSPPSPSLSLTARFRKLTREYGWSAFGVYMLLSLLDFPFCFAAVRYLGTDRIGHYEHVVVEWVVGVVPEGVREWWGGVRGGVGRMMGAKEVEGGKVEGKGGVVVEGYAVVEGEEGGEVYDHGVREAEERNEREDASIWTQLALAYAIHKSFIFIRVPLTAAVTPKVVKTLRGWGWDIGKRKPKGGGK
ncbi:hypothetical protein JMJ35_003161 [Cladonia borealis]|uniref:DUF1279 domain-containing protein n=1 Tax=Cladonia borealis TaxID=184061 RepID=A0AA39V6N0_9LECA|nr:hypothetical protein JMJ35_003161 [Cladonia borealis]